MNPETRRTQAVEAHHRAHELEPKGRFTYRGVDYVVAVGGPFRIDVPTTEVERRLREEHPHGYYEFSWALLRDEAPWVGGSNVIDAQHDLLRVESDRERARVNAARKDAEWAIDHGAKETLERDR